MAGSLAKVGVHVCVKTQNKKKRKNIDRQGHALNRLLWFGYVLTYPKNYLIFVFTRSRPFRVFLCQC